VTAGHDPSPGSEASSQPRASPARRWRRRLLIVLAIASPLLVLLYGGARRYLNARVSHLLPALAEVGRPGWDGPLEGSDIAVVVIDRTAVDRTQGAFDDHDWSWSWLNWAARAFGDPRVVSPAEMPVLSPRTAILLVTGSVGASRLPGVEDWVRRGGLLVVQAPSPLAALGGVTVKGPPTWAARVTAMADEPMRSRLATVPVHARRQPAGALADARPLVWLDGRPAAWIRPLGKGFVEVVAFDLGMALLAWRQGLPHPDFSIGERYGCLPGIVESDDLVMDPQMLHNPVPCADLLERQIFEVGCDEARIPTRWPVPGGAPAAWIVTHDDEGLGPRAMAPVIEDDVRRGFSPTVFAIGAGDPSQWKCDLELHWSRYLFPDLRRRTLAEQKSGASSAAAAVRIHYLDWGTSWDAPFAAMNARALLFDSSLGPNAGYGYLFGSGQLYRPLDAHGHPYDVEELPFEFQENWGGGGPAAMLDLLEHAVATDHTVIVSLTHADKWGASPEGRAAYDALAERAREEGVWMGSIGGLKETLGLGAGRPVALEVAGRRFGFARGWMRVPDPSRLRRIVGDEPKTSTMRDGTLVLFAAEPYRLEYR
jgi:hypothetical protein